MADVADVTLRWVEKNGPVTAEELISIRKQLWETDGGDAQKELPHKFDTGVWSTDTRSEGKDKTSAQFENS